MADRDRHGRQHRREPLGDPLRPPLPRALRLSPLALLPSPDGAEAYLALDKPAGRVVHGKEGLIEEARGLWGADLALVHRLDRETSGVLLLARDKVALARALEAWPERVTKVYVARTRGIPSPTEGIVDAPLLEHRTGKPELLRRALKAAYGPARAGHLLSGRRVGAIPDLPAPGRTLVHPAGRPARTAYRVLSHDGITALVELRPEQGRMHQLRVHLRHLGTPLLHDRLYDDATVEAVAEAAERAAAAASAAPAETEPEPAGPRPFLHATRLEWRDPPGAPPGTSWVWESPVPPDA